MDCECRPIWPEEKTAEWYVVVLLSVPSLYCAYSRPSVTRSIFIHSYFELRYDNFAIQTKYIFKDSLLFEIFVNVIASSLLMWST